MGTLHANRDAINFSLAPAVKMCVSCVGLSLVADWMAVCLPQRVFRVEKMRKQLKCETVGVTTHEERYT
ncbi:hypothetical protein RRG08_018049 [Elysia crispata]|uniref:Uncharacterized protein n=1 Tax=Elysia crispata TaxID=231223 RepID=A0AAE0ZDB1_9GAST|nr:hypothetical protein RRG08_018049 [Elysia crispata]